MPSSPTRGSRHPHHGCIAAGRDDEGPLGAAELLSEGVFCSYQPSEYRGQEASQHPHVSLHDEPMIADARGKQRGEAVRASPLQFYRGTVLAYGETTGAPPLSPLLGVAVTVNVPQVSPGHAP